MIHSFTDLLAGASLTTLPQQLASGILLGAIYALIALGYTMVYGVLKLINFAHGEVYMLGAYTALFVTWALGFTPNAPNPPEARVWMLLIMLLASMTVCAIVGILIERFAYRPLRNQPRIASLITAIGLSLLLQYGGQLVLPVSPPPSIDSKVNPFSDNVKFVLKQGDSALLTQAAGFQPKVDQAQAAFDAQLKSEKSQFDLSPRGEELKKALEDVKREQKVVTDSANASKVEITLPKGQLIMLGMVVSLMAALTYLVMFTKRGRAMRAVSLDFNASSLMGINVDSIVTFTFIVGSSLAGAGAMMTATFLPGTQINTYFGVLPGTKAFVAAVLGGIGNIPGAVLGGMLMGIAEVIVIWLGYDAYKDALAFVVLIAVLIFRPGGLLGSAKVEKV